MIWACIQQKTGKPMHFFLLVYLKCKVCICSTTPLLHVISKQLKILKKKSLRVSVILNWIASFLRSHPHLLSEAVCITHLSFAFEAVRPSSSQWKKIPLHPTKKLYTNVFLTGITSLYLLLGILMLVFLTSISTTKPWTTGSVYW